jgi:hypothetical protein
LKGVFVIAFVLLQTMINAQVKPNIIFIYADDLDADEIQGAEEGEKLALESEADKEARAASEARGVARRQNVESTTATGLEFRPYSED